MCKFLANFAFDEATNGHTDIKHEKKKKGKKMVNTERNVTSELKEARCVYLLAATRKDAVTARGVSTAACSRASQLATDWLKRQMRSRSMRSRSMRSRSTCSRDMSWLCMHTCTDAIQ